MKPLLVPVTVTVYVAAVVELQLRVDVAVPPAGGVTLLGDRVQMSPAGLTAPVKATAWLKVPVEVTVTVEVPATPALTVTEVGLADNRKSAREEIVTVTLVEFVITLLVPPVPLMTTV